MAWAFCGPPPAPPQPISKSTPSNIEIVRVLRTTNLHKFLGGGSEYLTELEYDEAEENFSKQESK